MFSSWTGGGELYCRYFSELSGACESEAKTVQPPVGGTGEGKNPMDFAHPSMAHLAHERDRLQPAETFLDPLSLSLTERIPSMSCGAAINGAATRSRMVLRHMRHHSHMPTLFHEIPRVKSFISTDAHRLGSQNFVPASPVRRRVLPFRWPGTLPYIIERSIHPLRRDILELGAFQKGP